MHCLGLLPVAKASRDRANRHLLQLRLLLKLQVARPKNK
eukprot:gene32646-40281_t